MRYRDLQRYIHGTVEAIGGMQNYICKDFFLKVKNPSRGVGNQKRGCGLSKEDDGRYPVKKIYRHIFGWFFIFLGIIGLFLPILQGVLFLFIGAIILAPDVPFFNRIIMKLEKKYPDIFQQANSVLHRMSHWSGKQHPGDKDARSDTKRGEE